MKLTGKITKVLPLQQGTSQQGAEWRKQPIVVIEDDPSIAFPNEMLFDIFGDKIPTEPLTIGQRVEVFFSVRIREYNGRIYNDVNVFRFNKV